MNYAPAPQPIFYRDRKVTRVAIGDIEKHRQEQGAFGFVGVDDHYFLSAIVPPHRQLAGELQSRRSFRCRGRAARCSSSRGACSSPSAPQQRRLLLRAERSRRSPEHQARSGAGDRLRHVRLARRAAAAGAQVGQQLRRQLRLVDHRADGHHQPGDVPAQAQEHRLDAQDAGAAAADEGDPGSLREAEDDRPRAPEDERRGHGALQAARHEPGVRMRADAADAAGAGRVLRHAGGGDRAARRAVPRLDQGSVSRTIRTS